MKKFILLVLLVALNAHADVAYQQKVPSESENDILTSQEYVDDRVGRSQDLIQPLPAGTTVDKIVVAPAVAGGTPGARDIVTDLATGASNGVPTADAVLDTTNTKNDKINKLNNQNVVTYTGTANNGGAYNGLGNVTGTPIYSKEMNTYENGLVRASTLNEAVQYAIDHELTRNDSDPQGTLWDVTALTAPAPLPVTANLPAADIHATSSCYKLITPTETTHSSRGACTATRWGPDVITPNEYSHAGDWGVVFDHETGIGADGVVCTGANSANCNKEIRGISACISEHPAGHYTGSPAPSSLWATLDASYNDHKNGEPLSSDAQYCYCKLTAPTVSGTSGTASRWVYHSPHGEGETCANRCPGYCVAAVRNNISMRLIGLFGAYDE
ncbi:MAG: hypothetical protein J6T57_02725 [Alphaproteobacteria bacterium]|nr:hypothetical protein [Alphaproteobacteria bacterium]